jgi:hypothetical protein
MVQKNRPKPQKKKNQQDLKPKNTTFFKKNKKDEEKVNCFTCGKTGHFARNYPDAKWKTNQKKSVNMVEAEGGTSGYGNLLHTVLSVFNSPDWWIETGTNTHVCADKSLFLLIRLGGLPPC